MAETKYSYSISQDIVAGAVSSDWLTQEINDSSIVTELSRIDTFADELAVWFVDALSAAEKTTVDGDSSGPAGGIIGAHDASQWTPPNEERRVDELVFVQSDTQPYYRIKRSQWQVAARLRFRGSNDMGVPLAVKALLWAESGGEVSARIYDKTNDALICAGASTTSEQAVVVDLGNVQNIPTGEAVWELQVKASGGEGRLHSLSIDYS